jgi:hypothetical protein
MLLFAPSMPSCARRINARIDNDRSETTPQGHAAVQAPH